MARVATSAVPVKLPVTLPVTLPIKLVAVMIPVSYTHLTLPTSDLV